MTIGQITHDAFYEKLAKAYQQESRPTHGKDPVATKCWEAAGQAAAAEIKALLNQAISIIELLDDGSKFQNQIAKLKTHAGEGA